MFRRLIAGRRATGVGVGVALVVEQSEVELLALKGATGNLDLHLVAEAITNAGATSDKGVIFLVEVVVVAWQIAHRYEALAHVIVELNIESPFGHARHNAIVDFAEMIGHIFDLLILDGCALGVGSELLHIG